MKKIIFTCAVAISALSSCIKTPMNTDKNFYYHTKDVDVHIVQSNNITSVYLTYLTDSSFPPEDVIYLSNSGMIYEEMIHNYQYVVQPEANIKWPFTFVMTRCYNYNASLFSAGVAPDTLMNIYCY